MDLIRNRTFRFFNNKGRRPRILITRVDSTRSDREAKIIATAVADMGFDVDINTSAQSPTDIARLAAENDVHAVGIADVSKDKQALIDKLITALDTEDGKNIVLAAWTHDKPEGILSSIKARPGRIAIFEIDSDITYCVNRILDVMEQPL